MQCFILNIFMLLLLLFSMIISTLSHLNWFTARNSSKIFFEVMKNSKWKKYNLNFKKLLNFLIELTVTLSSGI